MSKELKIAVQSGCWLNDVYGGDENALAAFEAAKAAGIEAIDFNIDMRYPAKAICAKETSEFFSQDIETILKAYEPVKVAMEKTGIEICQAHAPFPLYSRLSADFTEHLIMTVEKSIEICHYLSIPALVVHPWNNSFRDINKDRELEHEVNLKMYRRLMPIAKKYGVKICLENMFYYKASMSTACIAGACANASEAVWYIDKLNEEAGEDIFGFCFDLGHANLAKRNIREEIRTLGHRLTLLHLHDNDAMSDQHYAPMTQRKTDWDGLIMGLRDIGYRGPLNFEIFAAMQKFPKELVPAMLKYTAGVGRYLRNKILEETN
nr:sugar phosphate isomerase/epimerase [Clostridia bacterium]